MTPQDFLVNTRYIGEWETRVRNIVNAVKPPRRIVLYIPSIEELAWMGTSTDVPSATTRLLTRAKLKPASKATLEADATT